MGVQEPCTEAARKEASMGVQANGESARSAIDIATIVATNC
jgi:hypothetical protein